MAMGKRNVRIRGRGICIRRVRRNQKMAARSFRVAAIVIEKTESAQMWIAVFIGLRRYLHHAKRECRARIGAAVGFPNGVLAGIIRANKWIHP